MMLGFATLIPSLFSGAGLLKVGLLAATTVGSYMLNHNSKNKDQGKLNDLRSSCSCYGKGIPIIYGTMRASGNMFWATDLVEHKRFISSKGKDVTDKKKGSKKGSSKKGGHAVYMYNGNFAMGLCEGPVEEVLRVWADQHLIYDKYGTTPYDPNDPDANVIVVPGFTQQHDDGKKSMSGKKGPNIQGTFAFRFYSGTEEQLQDPFMVAKQSASTVPAFRGLCYLMFEDFALGDFGNRIPTITAEVQVRKKPAINFGVLANIETDPATPPAFNNGIRMCPDPSRGRFYVADDTWLRVFDIGAGREVQRVSSASIIPASSRRMIGVAVSGDLLWTSGGSNSNPLYFVDPNSFTVKQIFGRTGNSLHASIDLGANITGTYNGESLVFADGQIGTPIGAFPLVTIDSKQNTRPLTAVVTQWSDVLIYDDQNQPLSGNITNLGSIFGAGTSIVSGVPDLGITRFFMRLNYNTQGPIVWRLSANTVMPDDDDLQQAIKFGIVTLGGHDEEIFYAGELGPDDTSYEMSDLMAMPTFERVCFLEYITSNDLTRHGIWAVSLDMNTKAFDRWKVVDDPGESGKPFCAQFTPLLMSNEFYWRAATGLGNHVYKVDFRQLKSQVFDVPAGSPPYVGGQTVWVSQGGILHCATVNGVQHWVLCYADRLQQTTVSIETIVLDMADRVGIDPLRVDTSAMNDEDVVGVIIENPVSARQVVDDLCKVFMFDVVESDYKLKLVSRGNASVVTIPEDNLGIVTATGVETANDFYKEQRIQEVDLPERVNVSFINPMDKYQIGTAHFKRPRATHPVMNSREQVDLNLPMAMTYDRAKQLAQKVIKSTWAERVNHDFLLPWTYLKYDPTDVATFVMNDGLTFVDRLIMADVGADYSIQVKGVSQIASSYDSSVTQGDVGGVIEVPHPKPTATRPLVYDVPFLTDDDADHGSGFQYYWAAGGLSEGMDMALFQAEPEGGDWEGVGATIVEPVWGTCVAPTPPPPNGAWATDDQTQIVLFPAHSYDTVAYEWESIADADWPSEDNMILIGSEVILFKNATVNANGSITIDTLIRGHRGTELESYWHKNNEFFAVNVPGSVHLASEQLLLLNKLFTFRTTAPGLLGLLTFPTSRHLTGAPQKPYAPADFIRATVGSDLLITWQRRTRYDGGMADGIGTVPLNEETEAYEAYILTAPYDRLAFDANDPTTYVRAFTDLTTSQLTYTGAMLTTDSKTTSSVIHLVVFQLSAKVGRGFPGYDTLYHEFLT